MDILRRILPPLKPVDALRVSEMKIHNQNLMTIGGENSATINRILVVDDDKTTHSLLQAYLSVTGFDVEVASTAEEAWMHYNSKACHLVLLDLNLPDEDGLVVARKIRASSDIPIIMLTNRTDIEDKVAGLQIGADDYMVKPFEPRELLARIQNTLNRTALHKNDDRVMIGCKVFDPNKMLLFSDSEGEQDLTLGEARVLSALVAANGRVLSRDFLLDAITDGAEDAYYRTIDVLIYRLRKKIEVDPGQPVFLKTVKGLGYRLDLLK